MDEPVVDGPISRNEFAEDLVRRLKELTDASRNSNSVEKFDEKLVRFLEVAYNKQVESSFGNAYFDFEYRNNAEFRGSFIKNVFDYFVENNPKIIKMTKEDSLYEIVEDFCDASNKFRKTMFSYELERTFKLVKSEQMPVEGNVRH
jgi:hypothetical protein